MTAKKQTKPANATPETELLAKLQLELRSRDETLKRLAEMLGCMPGDLERAMGEMQAHVQAIRDVVEPEVADAHPENLAEACECLVRRLHMAGEDAEQQQTRWEQANARVEEMTAELNDAKDRIAKLEDENREAWVALDGAGAGTLIEVAEKRWKEIETLRKRVEELVQGVNNARESAHRIAGELESAREERDQAHNTIKHLEREIEELVESAALRPAQVDDGQAENILRDLMRKIVDGRISLLHNA